MSSAHGLHKVSGGFRARWRLWWAGLPTATCPLKLTNAHTGAERPCGKPAAGIVEGLGGPMGYICADHIARGRQLGYTIYTDPAETSST
jgi:hypothetical protein